MVRQSEMPPRSRKHKKQSATRSFRPNPKPTPLDPLPPSTVPIIRDGYSAVVYHIPNTPTPPSSSPILKTTISLPKHSTWTSGLHWHNSHTEYLRLIKGCIFVHLGTETKILSAAEGGEYTAYKFPYKPGLVVKVDKGVRHNWGRAQHYYHRRYLCVPRDRFPPDRDDEVVVEEWTDPSDIGKPLFFWNLNGVINVALHPPTSSADMEPRLKKMVRKTLGGWWVDLQLWIIFWELDNYPVFLQLATMEEQKGWMIGRLEWTLEVVMTYTALFLASVLGRLVGLEAVSKERTPKDLWEAWRREKGKLKEE